jgi:toxin HigB-1
MIKTFRCRDTEELFLTGFSRRLPQDIHKSGHRRLRALDAATSLHDLRGVGGSLEERRTPGTWSIRINDKYRIVFDWKESNAWEVEIEDHPKSRNKGR